jgi:hypothetical protein
MIDRIEVRFEEGRIVEAKAEGGNKSLIHIDWMMRQSGLADLLPSLRDETVYVGVSAGSTVVTPNFGGETYQCLRT